MWEVDMGGVSQKQQKGYQKQLKKDMQKKTNRLQQLGGDVDRIQKPVKRPVPKKAKK
jgi:hypothetical protein